MVDQGIFGTENVHGKVKIFVFYGGHLSLKWPQVVHFFFIIFIPLQCFCFHSIRNWLGKIPFYYDMQYKARVG